MKENTTETPERKHIEVTQEEFYNAVDIFTVDIRGNWIIGESGKIEVSSSTANGFKMITEVSGGRFVSTYHLYTDSSTYGRTCPECYGDIVKDLACSTCFPEKYSYGVECPEPNCLRGIHYRTQEKCTDCRGTGIIPAQDIQVDWLGSNLDSDEEN